MTTWETSTDVCTFLLGSNPGFVSFFCFRLPRALFFAPLSTSSPLSPSRSLLSLSFIIAHCPHFALLISTRFDHIIHVKWTRLCQFRASCHLHWPLHPTPHLVSRLPLPPCHQLDIVIVFHLPPPSPPPDLILTSHSHPHPISSPSPPQRI